MAKETISTWLGSITQYIKTTNQGTTRLLVGVHNSTLGAKKNSIYNHCRAHFVTAKPNNTTFLVTYSGKLMVIMTSSGGYIDIILV